MKDNCEKVAEKLVFEKPIYQPLSFCTIIHTIIKNRP